MMIVSRLSEMQGNRSATAESLGMSRQTLFNKMRQDQLSDCDGKSINFCVYPLTRF
jgi:DNA-binding NtrC family response regulator